MKYTGIICVVCILLGGCGQPEKVDRAAAKAGMNRVLDDWHNAAAEGDFERYFNYFASDSAIYMGTDATERWTAAEFKVWSKPYFEDGTAWRFAPVQRHIYIGQKAVVAWFDEQLDTPNLGPARGTGVLVKADTTWKIAHYNLSIPIPNAVVDTVVAQIEQALGDTAKGSN